MAANRPMPALAGWLVAVFAVPAAAQPAPPAPAPPAASAPARPSPVLPTPVAQRVLVVGALAKRTGETRFFTLKPGQYVDFAALRITARTCETTPPWERPALSGAFLQVDERRPGQPAARVFSGWLYAQSPSLNVMEHPRYDVWLKNCAMAFPESPPSAPPASRPVAPKSPASATAAAN